MAAGILTIVLGQHFEHDCLVQQGNINGMDVSASVAQCSGYNVAAGMGYLILVVGAGVVLLAALADTPSWRTRPKLRRSST